MIRVMPWQSVQFAARLAGLVAGFVAGQGSVFAVQTWLIAEGRLAIVASFGFAIAILSLVQWAADWGGLVLLSRYAIEGRDFGVVSAAHLARLIVALPITLGVSAFALLYRTDPLVFGMLLCGMAIAPVWAFNLSGFLDGHGKSAVSGPAAGLPWIGVATTTFVIFSGQETPSVIAGAAVGASYVAGCAICVLCQHIIVRSVSCSRGSSYAWADVWAFLREGGVYCAGEFPNQLYGRMLIVIVANSLGQHITALYVYIRQILIGAAQFIAFIKRVEFPRLGKVISDVPVTFHRILKAQIANIGASFAIFAASIIAFVAHRELPPHFIEVAYYFVFFAAILPIWAIAMSFGQVAILQNRMTFYSGILVLTIAISSFFTYSFTAVFGLTFVAACEVMMYVAQFSAYAWSARRQA
jgi:hypothetical protein